MKSSDETKKFNVTFEDCTRQIAQANCKISQSNTLTKELIEDILFDTSIISITYNKKNRIRVICLSLTSVYIRLSSRNLPSSLYKCTFNQVNVTDYTGKYIIYMYLYYTCYTCVLVNRTPPLWYITF